METWKKSNLGDYRGDKWVGGKYSKPRFPKILFIWIPTTIESTLVQSNWI
jgi:hypothetical protein